jgi:hypothetical protein
MLDLGQPMFDALLLAAQIEHMSRVSCRRAVRIPGRDALVDLDTRRARQLFEVKFWGQHHCVKYAAPRMAPHGSIRTVLGLDQPQTCRRNVDAGSDRRCR